MLLCQELPHTSLSTILQRLDAAAAALPARPDTALRELRRVRSLLTEPAEVAAAVPVIPLTTREREVLQLLARGNRNKEIALHLGLRERTVKFHVANLLRKLDVQSRTEALRRAFELNLLASSETGGVR